MDYKFLKELFKTKPAKITAESDDKGIMSIMLEGRGIELLALSFAIIDDITDQCPLTIDDYCERLKEYAEHKKKSKEQKDVENAIIDKILKDIFK